MNKNTAVMCGGCSAALAIAAIGLMASGTLSGGLQSARASVTGNPDPSVLASAINAKSAADVGIGADAKAGDESGSAARSAVRTATGLAAVTLPGFTEAVVAQPAPVTDRRTAAEAAAALAQLGITPERMAMAGGTINTMHAALTGAIIQGSTSPEELQAARTGQALRARAASSAYRAALSGSGTATGGGAGGQSRAVAGFSAQTMSAADQQAMQAAPPPAGEAVLAAISPVIAARLATMKANSHWNVPDRFLLGERSDAQWVALRDSLASLRISEQRGLPADRVAQGIVDAAENEISTIAARQLEQAGAEELRSAMQIVLGSR